jgi:hypothetical protein
VAPEIDTVSWHTEDSGVHLPEDQLGRSRGTATIAPGVLDEFAGPLDPPGSRPWKDDVWDPSLDGLPVRAGLSRDVRTRREHRHRFAATIEDGPGIAVRPLGDQAARLLEVDVSVRPSDPRVSLVGSWSPAGVSPWLEPAQMHGTDRHSLAEGANVVFEAARIIDRTKAPDRRLAVLDVWGPGMVAVEWRTRPFEPLALAAGMTFRSRLELVRTAG